SPANSTSGLARLSAGTVPPRPTLAFSRRNDRPGPHLLGHVRFTVDTGVQVYFCDPGHPWQRGTAENTVGLVRPYLPRGTSLGGVDQRTLNTIARELNQRPRKTLGWDSPAEAYARVL